MASLDRLVLTVLLAASVIGCSVLGCRVVRGIEARIVAPLVQVAR